MREAPAEFVAEMQRMFGTMWTVAWREHLSRWVVIGPTADGRLVEQTWGWFRRLDPETQQMVQVPTGEDGLPPYRGIHDRADQLEILTNMERSYLFNRADGDNTVRRRFSRIQRENDALRHTQRVNRAKLFADLLGEVRIARPWVKDHVRAKGAVLVASAQGVRRTALFDHHNGRPISPS